MVIAAVLVRRVVADNRTAVEQRLFETARAVSSVVDAELVGTIRALQGLGESDRLTTGEIPGFHGQRYESGPNASHGYLLHPGDTLC